MTNHQMKSISRMIVTYVIIFIYLKTKTRCEEIKVYTSVLCQKLREASTSSPTDHLGCNEEDHWWV